MILVQPGSTPFDDRLKLFVLDYWRLPINLINKLNERESVWLTCPSPTFALVYSEPFYLQLFSLSSYRHP